MPHDIRSQKYKSFVRSTSRSHGGYSLILLKVWLWRVRGVVFKRFSETLHGQNQRLQSTCLAISDCPVLYRPDSDCIRTVLGAEEFGSHRTWIQGWVYGNKRTVQEVLNFTVNTTLFFLWFKGATSSMHVVRRGTFEPNKRLPRAGHHFELRSQPTLTFRIRTGITWNWPGWSLRLLTSRKRWLMYKDIDQFGRQTGKLCLCH